MNDPAQNIVPPDAESRCPILLPSKINDNSQKNSVILFHGLTGTPIEMKALASALHDKGFEIFVPILSGHGSSVRDLKQTPTSAWINDAVEAFEKISSGNPRRIFVAGLSFGGLLALTISGRFSSKIAGVACLSSPFRLRKQKLELIMSFLALLPEALLNFLPIVDKPKRKLGIFSEPRFCFSQHSIGGVARMFKLRNELKNFSDKILAPVLIMQDPNDHHLSPNAPYRFRSMFRVPNRISWVVGGEHELTLGPAGQEVIKEVVDFFTSIIIAEG